MNSHVASRFRYEAATTDGRVVDGVLDAPSREVALGELRRRELFVIALDDAAPKSSARRGSGATSLALWTRTLATMLGAGVRLDEALAFGADQAAPTPLGDAVR